MHLYDFVGADRLATAVPLLVSAFAKASAIFLLGGVCAMLARGAAAATRHMIWTLTLAGAIAAPIVSAFVPRWTIPISRWSIASIVPDAFIDQQFVGEPATAVEPAIAVEPLMPVEPVMAVEPATPVEPVMPVEPEVAVEAAIPVEPVGAVEPVAAGEPSSDVAPAIAAGPAVGATAIESRSITITPEIDAAPMLAAADSASPTLLSLAPWIVALWALGAIIALVPTLAGFARLALVARRARPMHGGRWALLIPSVMRELDVRRRVRFVELDGPVMPMTWGVFHPVVLLPADDFNSTIEQRLDVLRHELAHVRRYDCLTQLVGQVACALHWFNPLAWIAARELRVERERACDDEVLRAGSKASDYADYLLRVARSTRIVGAAALSGLAMARPSQMAGRLLAVLDERRRRGRVSGSATAYSAMIAASLVGAVASASPVRAATGGVDLAPVVVEPAALPVPAMAPVRAEPAVAPAPADLAPIAQVVEPTAALLPPTLASTLIAPVWSTAAPAIAAIATSRPSVMAAPCERTARKGKSSHTNWTSSDNGSKRWRVLWSEGDCAYEIEARGDVKFNRDVTDIESITSGGMFTIEQHIGDDTKRLVVRPRDDGGLDRSYSVNGARHEFDAEARAWFAEALVALDRQTAFAADQRVPAILERGGVEAVLQEITLVGSDYARRRYYTKLLSMRQLDRGQVKRVVEQAGADMSSDYELAELLVALSKLDAFGDDSHTAFVTAARKINSDYERRRALNALLQRDRLAPATVQALLETASTIGSDYELAELMIDVSKRYAINDQTRPTYIKALGSIKSDYEHRRVLAAIVAGGGLTPAVNRALLEDAARIGSDYELAEFLIQIGKKRGLDASTRDAYFAAADKIKSDYEHHRALTPLLTRDLLTKDLAKAILASASKIDSDYECATLLVEVANAITIDDDLRPAFDRAADTIQGEYEYGRAMSAVRRRATR